ncbi:SMP-30/Gluconolaconase/LRE-like region-containing protein [Methylorubrum extorquens DSM 13060]|uniref:SMP-30/Gluconolaconase/LRE-like region-containing protein n=1 Tax=Methylorubrum extorquens DSM 13060 TaxID=882800 RepID=H1KMU4_METEX|nr:SMP-30/Gluconolaconase/LRE-like region-containing protein [Methylorubrum extorquens DSM 13060]
MAASPSIRVLDPSRCHLGEGPSYDPATDTAWWVDILENRLFELPLSEGAGPAKMHALPFMASDVAAIDADRQLLSAEDGLYIRTIRDGQLSLFCPLEAEDAGTRSNDGRVHPSGALWISTMGRDAETGRGAIYHVAGTRVTRLFSGLSIPNGIAFSPDRGGSVCLNSELGLDEWISCRVQAATGCGSLSK